MAYDDLRDFIRALEKKKELKRVSLEVDPRLEMTEFADRSVKTGGPALLFENPKGYKHPVLLNAFASMRRMEIALEVDSVDEVADRITGFLQMRMPQGLIGKIKMLPKLAEVGSFFPKIVSKGACQEIVRTEEFSLAELPVLTCWPHDGGPFVSFGPRWAQPLTTASDAKIRPNCGGGSASSSLLASFRRSAARCATNWR